jgi:translation initiation factor 3 subunit A
MSFQPQLQPKNALRKARDFLKVGRVQDACDSLHTAITTKRAGRIWTPEHEEMMLEFVTLCVELRDPRRAKDGLYHYRQMTQVQAPQSLEKVINALIELSARKAADARVRASVDAGGGAGGGQLAAVEDLEDENQSPESLLMGAVTSEGSKERAEREILLPWVRHMWDTYRNVLETLRYATKLERAYHSLAVRAMAFCKAYARSAEFRKLAKMLRDHFAGLRRTHEANGTVLGPETVEHHLTTRFAQLEHCADMSLWNEGFRTIEDIYGERWQGLFVGRPRRAPASP